MNHNIFSGCTKREIKKILLLFLLISSIPGLTVAQEENRASENKHYQQITPSIDKSAEPSTNFDNSAVTTINLGSYESVVEDRETAIASAPADSYPLFGGESSATIKTGDAIAGESTGHSRAESAITLPANINFSLKTQGNSLTLKDEIGFTGSLYGGQSAVELMTGATQGDKVTSDGQYGFSVKNSSLNIYGEMSISSLKNQVSLLSSQNIIDSVIGGEALLDGKTGSAQKGDIKNQPTSQNSLSRLENRASAFTNIDSNKIALDASENRIQSSSDANLLVGGKASVQLISGNATSGDITIDTTEDIAAENYTFANSYVVARDLNLKASSNHVETTGNSKTIYGGDATLLLQAADATAGDVTYQNGTKIFADVDANAITRATGSVINASDNAILSAGSANKVVGGNAVASLRSGNAAAGNITSNSNIYDRNPEYHDPADPEGNLPHKKAYAYSEIYADSMTLQANKNRVEVADKGSVSDLIGGYTALNLRAGSATSGAVIHSGDYEQSSDKIDAGANIDLKNTVLEANDNSVKLLGTLNDGGNIYGGDIHYAITPGNAYFSNGSEIAGRNQVLMDGTQVSAINNLVELGEFAKVENGGQLYGGRLTYNDAYSASQYDLFTGNRLHVSAKSPLYFQDVANFEYYQFTLTPQLANKNIAIINADTITLGSHNGNYGDYQDRNSNRPSDIKVVGMHSGDTLLGAGDQFILMQAGAGKLTGDATAGTDQITQLHQGISLIYDVETVVEYENDRVITVIKSGTNRPDEPSPPDKPNPPAVQVNPKLKAIGDGRLAMEELLLRGADNLTGIMRKNQVDGYVPFADFYAGHSKYTNGSTIRANEYIITMGVTYQKDRWVIAPIIEYGWSDYKTDTPYGNHLSSRGSGDNYYYGLGLLSRYNFENGFYLDGGIRYGRSRNKFNSKDLAHVVTKELASYKISSPYWGAHLSLGYQIAVAERQQLDLSSTFLWTRLSGKNTRITGDPIYFGAINSKRLNLAAEWRYQYRPNMTFKAGVAYEYEFDTDFNFSTYQTMKVDTGSLKGSSGIVNIGATLKPSETSRFSYDTNLSGYFGKRKGGEISIRVNYEL